jgi:hypothetical protein
MRLADHVFRQVGNRSLARTPGPSAVSYPQQFSERVHATWSRNLNRGVMAPGVYS